MIQVKEGFRKRSLERLKKAKKTGYRRDFRIIASILSILKNIKFRSILLFLPLPIEPDINKLIKYLKRKGVILYVPAIDGVSFKMLEYRPPLKKGEFGILEPKMRKISAYKTDIAIVPVVGIDAAFARIGFGKGMYDRFFENLKKRPLVIFTQRVLCLSKDKISQPHDIRGDFLVTSECIFRRKGKLDDRVHNHRGRLVCSRGGRLLFGEQKIK